jgi:hypothetical protein
VVGQWDALSFAMQGHEKSFDRLERNELKGCKPPVHVLHQPSAQPCHSQEAMQGWAFAPQAPDSMPAPLTASVEETVQHVAPMHIQAMMRFWPKLLWQSQENLTNTWPQPGEHQRFCAESEARLPSCHLALHQLLQRPTPFELVRSHGPPSRFDGSLAHR